MKGRVAIREGNWKLIRYDLTAATPGPWSLYDLSQDPGERNNVANDHPDVVKRLEQKIRDVRTESEVFPLSTAQILTD